MSKLICEFREVPSILPQDEADDEGFIEIPGEGPGRSLQAPSEYESDTGPVRAHNVRADRVLTAENGADYEFLFWNVPAIGTNGEPMTTDDPTLDLTVTGTVTATAWYVPVGTGGDGKGGPGVRALAFSPEADRFYKETPIEQVSPPGMWAGGNAHTVSTREGVEILSRNPLRKTPEASFRRWITGNKPGFTATGQRLAVVAGVSAVAVAPYELPHGPHVFHPERLVPEWVVRMLQGKLTAEELIELIRGHGPRPYAQMEAAVRTLEGVRRRTLRLEELLRVELSRPDRRGQK